LSSSFWRESFHKRRCLIPVTSSAEPKEVTPATWHWSAIKGSDARPLFAFAGHRRHHVGPIKKDGPSVELDVFSFLTTTPNPLVGSINHERMPALLSTEPDLETWLSGTPEAALNLVHPYPADRMRMVQSGFDNRDALGSQRIS
jgi:putative SOS response-associated peptidase YedK